MDSNLTNTYPTGVWCIDQNNPNMAIRNSNGKTIKVPATKEILKEIKKQIEANKVFQAFQTINIKDEGIIGYLNVILRDYINYLDSDNLTLLINEMQELEQVDHIDTQNAFYIKNMSNHLKNKNTDEFEETLEQFQIYNQEYLTNAFSNEQAAKRH